MILKANSLYIPLKDESINCVVTSPPYWGLRKYDIPDLVWDGEEGCEHEWGEVIAERVDETGFERNRKGLNRAAEISNGNPRAATTGNPAVRRESQFCLHCSAWRGQLGLEPTIELYLSHLLQITKEIWRVLRPNGVFFLNIGDSYASGKGTCFNPGGGEHSLEKKKKEEGHVYPLDRGNKSTLERDGLKPKDLCLIPFRLALVLQDQGWWVRSDIIWSKKNPMPESVKDRPTRSHEYLFLLTKSQHYFWDQDAVRENFADERMGNPGGGGNYTKHAHLGIDKRSNPQKGLSKGIWEKGIEQGGRNIRSVWTGSKPKWKLRSDLSDDDRAYVLGELARRGLVANNLGSRGDHP